MNFTSYLRIISQKAEPGSGDLAVKMQRFVQRITGGGLYDRSSLPTTQHIEKVIVPRAIEKDLEGMMYLIAMSPTHMQKVYKSITHNPNIDRETRERLWTKWQSACMLLPYLPEDFPEKGARYARSHTLRKLRLYIGTLLHVIDENKKGMDGRLAGYHGDKIGLSSVPLHFRYMWAHVEEDLPRSLRRPIPVEPIKVLYDKGKRNIVFVSRINMGAPEMKEYMAKKGNRVKVSTGMTPSEYDLGEAFLYWYREDVLLNVRVEGVLKYVKPHPNFIICIKDIPMLQNVDEGPKRPTPEGEIARHRAIIANRDI